MAVASVNALADRAETTAEAAAGVGLTYPELEARVEAYRQYHAEEDLLACLREAKSEPQIRGTHLVGPRLKQLAVAQELYADFRTGNPDLTPEDRRRVERKIVALRLEQQKHIEFARGLFANGGATTNEALLEYHDTGCIGGLRSIVEEIRQARETTAQPEAP